MILLTCLCCKREAWLSILLEAGLGNVLEDPVLTRQKREEDIRDCGNFKISAWYLKSNKLNLGTSKKKVKSDLSICQC